MKKLLFLAITLVVAGSIAFALSGTSRSNVRSGSQAVERDEPQDLFEPLGWNQCLCDFYIVEALPWTPGTCKVVFGVKHIEKSDACCNHDPVDVRISVNSSPYQPMTQGLTEEGDPCDKLTFTSGMYYLPSGVEASWSIVCDGHGECDLSGSITPYCD